MRGWWIGLMTVACSSPVTVAGPDVKPQTDDDGHIIALACPGDVGCAVVDGPMLVGVAKRSITPAVETWIDANDNGRFDEGEVFEDHDGDGVHDDVWLAGFSFGRAATGVHDDNWARVITFERGDLRIALVSLDLIGYFNDDVLDIRTNAVALGFDHVMVASTHQHEGKDTMGPWGATPLETGRDDAYMARIVDQTIAALEEATNNQRPARLMVATATTTGLIHDSREPEVIDPTITALAAIDESNKTFMTMVIWGNHPEALDSDNTLITSDYPHDLRERLEATYPDSTSVFFAGTLGGLMNPLHIQGCPDANGIGTCPSGTYELSEYIGEGVAAQTIKALDAATPSEDRTLSVRREPFDVTIGNIGFLTGYLSGLFERHVFDTNGRPIPRVVAEQSSIDDALEGRIRFQSEVDAITIGPLHLLTVPGELYPELWLAKPDGASYIVRNEGADFFPDAMNEPPLSTLPPTGRVTALINQGNDALGYIIPKVQYDFDEPFAFGRRQYGEVNSVGPDIAPQIASAVERLYEQ